MAVVVRAVSPRRVTASVSAVTLLDPLSSRRAAVIYNDSPQDLYVKYGPSASTTDFTFIIGPSGHETVEYYTGAVTGVWGAALGAAQITEMVEG